MTYIILIILSWFQLPYWTKTYFQTGNNFELKLEPVLISCLDLWHKSLTSSHLIEVSSTWAAILSIVDITIHDNSLISQTVGFNCLLLLLNVLAPKNGEEFISRVAPDLTWKCQTKCIQRAFANISSAVNSRARHCDGAMTQYRFVRLLFKILNIWVEGGGWI